MSPDAPPADAFVARFVVEPLAGGVLAGTTFAAKDVFDVAGRPTGCGNPTWLATHVPAAEHAAAVRRLLEAGARLTGKTRTEEMAYSLDGRNAHEGAPLNPAAPDRLTGGSSSGSASAVAGAEVDFALGTDTAGSVRVPAAWCGVIGLRTTHGRVSKQGLTPLAPSFDTVGWMARSGRLMRAVGAVLLEGAPAAGAATVLAQDPAMDRMRHRAARGVSAEAVARFESSVPGRLRVDLGVDLDQAQRCLRTLQGWQAWQAHGAWIERHAPRFGPGVAERFAAARSITAAQAEAAARERDALIARIDAVLPPGTLLSLPAVPGPAALRTASHEELMRQRERVFPLTVIGSLTGRPQLSLPLESAEGAPVGWSLLGWRHGDEALLEIAARVFA